MILGLGGRKSPRPSEPILQPAPSEEDDLGLDLAWRIHAALVDWTGKVDTKASFAFAIESAIVLAVVGQTKSPGLYASLEGIDRWLYGVGLALILVGILMAASVVTPRLRRRASKREWRENFIYFGHLRHWRPEQLAAHLQSIEDPLPILSRQLVNMSKIAWSKHVLVQISMFAAGLGALSLGLVLL